MKQSPYRREKSAKCGDERCPLHRCDAGIAGHIYGHSTDANYWC